jgi:hypothetical protein
MRARLKNGMMGRAVKVRNKGDRREIYIGSFNCWIKTYREKGKPS